MMETFILICWMRIWRPRIFNMPNMTRVKLSKYFDLILQLQNLEPNFVPMAMEAITKRKKIKDNF